MTGPAPDNSPAVAATPALLAVTGSPTPEELAAVVAVLASRGGAPEPTEPAVPSRWNDREALLRGPLRRGPGAWRAGLGQV